MLEARRLSKSYGKRQVLKCVSFLLPPGQCLGLVGSNGSGKSTLLRLLAQVTPPDSGEVLFEGRSVLGDKTFLRRQLGYVPQRAELCPEWTGAQQLALWQRACGLTGPIPEDVKALLGLEELLDRPVKELSGGMAQRLNIALALLAKPRILLMDEAASALDQAYVPRLLDWLEAFLAQGGSLIWCSHRPAEIERLCGAVLYLDGGEATLAPPTLP